VLSFFLNKKIEKIFFLIMIGNNIIYFVKTIKSMTCVRNGEDCCKKLVEVTNSKIKAYQGWCPSVGLDEKQYQLEGIKWCIHRELVNKSGGGIIADEMGLGKTILMIACIRHNFQPRTLIVLPPALLQQWVGVFQRFLGHTPFVYHGSKAKNITVEKLMQKAIVITTYGMITPRTDKQSKTVTYSKLHKVEWSRIIYDEAHHLRNLKAKVHDGAQKLKANIRWMVTGTPINNNIKDLYALFKILGLGEVFTPKKEDIKRLLRIYLLRRTKAQVGIKLPPITNKLIEVEWASEEERDMATDIHANQPFASVNKDNVDGIIAWLNRHPLAALTRARQICIYPQLLHKAVEKMKKEGYIPRDVNIKDIKTNSKIDAIVKQITANRRSGKRKLVFSYYHGEIDVLKLVLEANGMTVQTIDGRTKTRDKHQRVLPIVNESQFRSVCKVWKTLPDEMFGVINSFISPEVMIVQIQTACEGLNMQHFQEIYFTSPHWNPAVEDKAVARAHRIGQDKAVDVYRFVMNGFSRNSISLDQYCSQVQDRKREVMKIITF